MTGATAPPLRPEFTANTLSEFMLVVEERMSASNERLWYRGLRNATYGLVPCLYRHPDFATMDADARVGIERKLLSQFRNRSLPFDVRTRQNDWDYLFLMQHSGVPTRLLDWTENPLIGLYFAVEQADDPAEPAAVWILAPGAWNEEALSASSYHEGILSLEEAEVRGYAPSADHTRMNNHPVAISCLTIRSYAPRDNSRSTTGWSVILDREQHRRVCESFSFVSRMPGRTLDNGPA